MEKEYLKLSEAAPRLAMSADSLRRHLNALQEKHGLERGRLIINGHEIARRFGSRGWWKVASTFVSREKDLGKSMQT